MGTVYANPAGKDLYAFWGDHLADAINQDLKKQKSSVVINLASHEYFKAAKASKIEEKSFPHPFLMKKMVSIK